MRACEALVIEPAKSWRRLQQGKDLFEDLEAQRQEQYQLSVNRMMETERQSYLKHAPYEPGPERIDQAHGFYQRGLMTRSGTLALRVPRSRSGKFQSQTIPRYERRCEQVNQALHRKPGSEVSIFTAACWTCCSKISLQKSSKSFCFGPRRRW